MGISSSSFHEHTYLSGGRRFRNYPSASLLHTTSFFIPELTTAFFSKRYVFCRFNGPCSHYPQHVVYLRRGGSSVMISLGRSSLRTFEPTKCYCNTINLKRKGVATPRCNFFAHPGAKDNRVTFSREKKVHPPRHRSFYYPDPKAELHPRRMLAAMMANGPEPARGEVRYSQLVQWESTGTLRTRGWMRVYVHFLVISSENGERHQYYELLRSPMCATSEHWRLTSRGPLSPKRASIGKEYYDHSPD